MSETTVTATVTVDPESGAAYVKLTDPAGPLTTWSQTANIDVDSSGNVVGIEILNWPPFSHMHQTGHGGTTCWTCGAPLTFKPDPATLALVQDRLAKIRADR